jgi:predicted O-methyltransferase YrrM
MHSVKKFVPKTRRELEIKINQDSAWGNIPTILHDIISRFNINTNKAIEFGVEYGYSTAALANYFDKVIGVDIFTGDEHAGFKGDIYEDTKNNLIEYKGIELIKKSYQEFITNNNEQFDFAHVDIIHTYEDTFACGEWCVLHADVVIFHDTISFPEVFNACLDLSTKYNLDFYNYEESFGLGILVKKPKNKTLISKLFSKI